MPTGKSKCPICKGTGIVTEDSREYEFITRGPDSNRCLICNGKGYINSRQKLPDGREAHTIMPKGGLNVSRKRRVNPEIPDIGIDRSVPQEVLDKPAKVINLRYSMQGPGKEVEVQLSPRLCKVLSSGKQFLIVAETEPYYLAVFGLIRKQEKLNGEWTAADEERYVQALEGEIKKLNAAIEEVI